MSMKERWLARCLLAYPKASRERDGGYLLDLALELGETSGARRQAFSLLRGGLAERVRGVGRRAVLVASLGAASLLVVGGVAVADDGSVEVEVQSCAPTGAGCAEVDDWAADRERHGWRCDRTSSRGEVLWQCTRS
jgi:hypothetical protein